jgi:predicted dehydrogenase
MKTMIIGFGRMGQRHLQVCGNLNLDVVSIYDLAAVINQDGTAIKAISTFEQDIDSRPDLVIIASTAPSHFDYAKLCFMKEIPYILCEKPLCSSLNQLKELQRLQLQYPNVHFAVNHPMRYMEQFNKIKTLIETEHYGELSSISIQGGNVGAAMNATHYFEALRFLTNEYAEKVWAWLEDQKSPNPRGAQYQDQCGTIRVETASGKRLYMDISHDQGHGLFVTYTCAYGQIHVDELEGRVYASQRKNPADLKMPTTRYGLESQINEYKIKPIDALEPTQKLIEALLTGQKYPTMQDGIMTVKTLIAALASSELHTMIDVNHIPLSYSHKVFPWA